MASLTSAIVAKALDGLSAREIALAENVANANTQGYRPLKVSFEEALAAAAQTNSREAVDAVTPRLTEAPLRETDGLRVDLELNAAASTAMRYSALIQLLGRRNALEMAAMRGSVG